MLAAIDLELLLFLFRHLSREYRELRAYQIAKSAMYTGGFLAFGDLGKMVTLGVGFLRILEDFGRAIIDAEIALLASLGDDMHTTDGNLC
jgi:hypothetical protein